MNVVKGIIIPKGSSMFTVKVDAGFQGFEATVKLVITQAFTITLKLSDCVAAVG